MNQRDIEKLSKAYDLTQSIARFEVDFQDAESEEEGEEIIRTIRNKAARLRGLLSEILK